MFYDTPPEEVAVEDYTAEIAVLQAAMDAAGIACAQIGASTSSGYDCLPLVCHRYAVVLSGTVADSVADVKAAAAKEAAVLESHAVIKAAIMAGSHQACQRAADMVVWFAARGITRGIDEIAHDVAWAVVNGD